MKISTVVIICLAVIGGSLASLYFGFKWLTSGSIEEQIEIDAFVTSQSEIRRHLATSASDQWRRATLSELNIASNENPPNYLVARFKSKTPGHYYGVAEARIDGFKSGPRFDVTLHFNLGWVEYHIPLDGLSWISVDQDKQPPVEIVWKSLNTK